MASLRASIFAAAFSYLTLVSAQSNSTNSSSECPYNQAFRNGYNASGSITVPGFRINDSFPASTWTWSQYIVNVGLPNDKRGVQNTLGLKTDPVQNLSDPSNPYTGCIIVPFSLKRSSKNMEDDGTCSSVFSEDCLSLINETLSESASQISGSATGSSSKVTVCTNLIRSIKVNEGKCKDAWGGFASSRFLPNNFTSSSKPSDGCTHNPGDSNATTGDFLGWSDTSSTAADNFTEYDLSIIYPTPIFVAVWLKDTSNGTGVQTSYSQNYWSDTRIMCLPGNVTTEGSRNITQALAESGSGKRISSLLTVAVVAAFVGLIL